MSGYFGIENVKTSKISNEIKKSFVHAKKIIAILFV